jgi:hypothetical protein
VLKLTGSYLRPRPSRPASKASAMRVISFPALTASSRQRCSSASSRSPPYSTPLADTGTH